MKYEKTKNGVIKRSEQKAIGIFIDGTGLDRATRRINKKIDMKALLKNFCLGLEPTVARYYTIIPYEDDSRQRAYLDAVQRAGFQVIVKRLPPKNVQKQVQVDTEMSADIIAFSVGYTNFQTIDEFSSTNSENEESETPKTDELIDKNVKKVINVVCPSQELTYAISLANNLHAETVCADFGKLNANKEILRTATNWIDLSDSETIWRD